jgi:hypothetical protein
MAGSKHYEMRYKTNYIAKLREQDGECTEVVFFNGEQIHRATFSASNLGLAKRGEYLSSMVASIAREHQVEGGR